VLTCSCGSEGEGAGPTFALGWLVLAALSLCMVVLFVGLIRYIKGGGAQSGTARPAALEYEYDEEEE